MTEWQVQKSRHGLVWVAMEPAGDHPTDSMVPGDHWFAEREPAFIAAQHLRNAYTWSEVRIVRRDDGGQIVDEGTVL